jgi:hypothetical protein
MIIKRHCTPRFVYFYLENFYSRTSYDGVPYGIEIYFCFAFRLIKSGLQAFGLPLILSYLVKTVTYYKRQK